MKKKTLIIVVASFAALAIAVGLYFLLFAKKEVSINNTVKAIPENACFMVEIKNFDAFYLELVSKNPAFQKFTALPSFKKAAESLQQIQRIAASNETASAILSGSPLFASAHISGKDKVQWFFAIALPAETGSDEAISMMKQVFADSASCSERKFDTESLYDLKYNTGKKTLCFGVFGRILIWSYSGLLVEESIKQLKGNSRSLAENTEFSAVYKSAGQKEMANIYWNTAKIVPVFAPVQSQSAAPMLTIMSNFGSWSEFDLGVSESLLSFSGFTAISDSSSMLTNLVYSQAATENTIEAILPTNTIFYLRMAFTDASSFTQKMNSFNKQCGKDEEITKSAEAFNQRYNVDVQGFFYPLISAEIGIATVEKTEAPEANESFLIIRTKSKTTAEAEIKKLCETFAKTDNQSPESYVKSFKIDEGAVFDVYTFKAEELGSMLFGPVFGGIPTYYVCFYDTFMIFGESQEALQNLIRMAVLNKTLGTDLKHAGFMSGFSKKSNLFLYMNLSRAKSLIGNYLNEENAEVFNNAFGELSNISDMALHYSVTEGMLFNYGLLQFDPELRDEPQTIWASKLDSSVYVKPVIVINHQTQGKEIIVQDRKNILHLISESGREIWKTSIGEPIIGEIYQVDAFGNGKLQYLFSTETRLHLIDRLGNYVDNFPVTFREKTLAGASLFDYENNKSYRIMVACTDKKVYMYDIEGKLVKGWEFQQTDNPVYQPAAHYRSGGNDFIVFNDEYKVYVIDRRGVPKAQLNTAFTFSKNNRVIFDAANGKTPDRLIASSNNGTVYFMELNGKTDSLNLGNYSNKHYFTAYDLDNNGIKEFIFVDGTNIDVFKQDKTKLFSLNLNANIDGLPNFYRFSRNQIKIGLVSREKEMIYLLNSDGTLFDGFPLRGVSPFSIGYLNNNTGSFNLVCGGGENFLYNYQVVESTD